MRRLLLIVALASMVSCTNASGARRVLEQNGYRDITAGGYDFFGCSKDDTFATKFAATSPSGQRVKGVVCADWFKGSTIRFH